MKTKNLLIFSVLFLFSQLSIAQFKVESTGKVSVGTVHTLDNGRLKIGNDGINDGISFYNASTGGTDARIFRTSNIWYFTRGADMSNGIRIDNSGKVAMGVNPTHDNTFFDGLKAVSYSDMVGLLIEAMKEQQHEIESLRLEVATIKSDPSAVNFRSSTGISEILQQCVLTQNAPNPFTHQTEIKFHVASGVKDAYILIFNMEGKMLKKINAVAGHNSVTIHGSALPAGMYLYTLVVDGQEADTKRMILTK